LPYAFASHFAPALMMDAIEIYRTRFRRSEYLTRPHVMLGLNVVAAETDGEARRLFTSHQQAFVNLRRGMPGPLPPPNEQVIEQLPAQQRWELDQTLSMAVVGSPATVQLGLQAFIASTKADEIIIVAQIFDHEARLTSYEITADALSARTIPD
jgi:luciferase family oxidoreductase group 1